MHKVGMDLKKAHDSVTNEGGLMKYLYSLLGLESQLKQMQ
jgi:hypothetical protein